MKKKLTAITMSLVLAATMILTVTPTTADAASTSVSINKSSANQVVTYKPRDKYDSYETAIRINGCTQKSQIKNLKSSNKNVTVTAQNGWIKAVYKDKALKTTITCTVKGAKLKTTLTVKKYINPIKVLKIGTCNLTSKFNKTNKLSQNKIYTNKKLNIQTKAGWKITSVIMCENKKVQSYNDLNTSKFTDKVTLKNKDIDYIDIICKNNKTGVSECISISAGSTSTVKPTKTEPTHTHSYTASVTKKVTCSDNGVRTYKCSCGDSYTESIAATGHNWIDNGPDVWCDWAAAMQEDTGYTSNVEIVTSIHTCRTCGYYLGHEDKLTERYCMHFLNESSTCPGSYTTVPVYEVHNLLSCSKCGAYKRGDFVYYQYPTWYNGNFNLTPVYVNLNEWQIQELGLIPTSD